MLLRCFIQHLLTWQKDNYGDEESHDLLDNMAKYGYKLGEIENELLETKKTIDKDFKAFEEQTQEYWKAKNDFEALEKKLQEEKAKNPFGDHDELEQQVAQAYDQLQLVYSHYSTALNSYKTTSTKYLSTTMAYFDDLENETGVAFDDVLKEISDSTIIGDEVKEMIIPVGDKIKAIKDSVDVITKMINALSVSFSDSQMAYNQLDDVFESFDIHIDQSAGDTTIDLLDQQYTSTKKGKK